MKKITILAATLLMMAMTAQAQEIEKLLSKYSNDERFTYVSLNADLITSGLSFIDSKLNNIDKIVKDELLKIKGLKVLTLESKLASEKKLTEQVITELNNIIKKDSNSEAFLETRSQGNETKIYATSEGLLIVNKEPKELSIVFLSGELSRKSIKEFISNISKQNKKQF
ncbi:MAG: DUF4252 domain-containing protein [Prevotellaceae bacterium]|jgi:hypothetical protein|nr:DUF4252 domain-containing protein [Prevotellaceae bacterium]